MHTSEARGSDAVEDQRDAIMKDLYLHQTDIDEFINSLLPEVHQDISIETVLNALAKEDSHPWRVFEAKPELGEDGHFQNVKTLFDRIVDSARQKSKAPNQTFTYDSNPTQKPSVPDRMTSNKPDGFIKFITDKKDLYKDWYGYALVAGYKLFSANGTQSNMITMQELDVRLQFNANLVPLLIPE